MTETQIKKRHDHFVFSAWTFIIVLGWILLIGNGSADGSSFGAEASEVILQIDPNASPNGAVSVIAGECDPCGFARN